MIVDIFVLYFKIFALKSGLLDFYFPLAYCLLNQYYPAFCKRTFDRIYNCLFQKLTAADLLLADLHER